ncbi:hypothetical protein EDD86DRAFT_219816 [Gorgonomyces haynaldii]|nr:hypothetical protein EDD86DRAFT_219816 [Gorgonomyces haynaldii]
MTSFLKWFLPLGQPVQIHLPIDNTLFITNLNSFAGLNLLTGDYLFNTTFQSHICCSHLAQVLTLVTGQGCSKVDVFALNGKPLDSFDLEPLETQSCFVTEREQEYYIGRLNRLDISGSESRFFDFDITGLHSLEDLLLTGYNTDFHVLNLSQNTSTSLKAPKDAVLEDDHVYWIQDNSLHIYSLVTGKQVSLDGYDHLHHIYYATETSDRIIASKDHVYTLVIPDPLTQTPLEHNHPSQFVPMTSRHGIVRLMTIVEYETEFYCMDLLDFKGNLMDRVFLDRQFGGEVKQVQQLTTGYFLLVDD